MDGFSKMIVVLCSAVMILLGFMTGELMYLYDTLYLPSGDISIGGANQSCPPEGLEGIGKNIYTLQTATVGVGKAIFIAWSVFFTLLSVAISVTCGVLINYFVHHKKGVDVRKSAFLILLYVATALLTFIYLLGVV